MANSTPTDREYFDRASWFHYSALFLLQQPKEMRFIHAIPAIVLKAFATEAYLKSLVQIEGKTPLITHHFLRLFDELETESKKQIQQWWNKESAPQLKKMRRATPPPASEGFRVPKNMRDALNQSADAFVDWRYRSGKQVIAFSILGFPLFVRRLIVQKRPDWKPPAHNPLSALDPDPKVAVPEDKDFAFDALTPPELNREPTASNGWGINMPDPHNRGPHKAK